MIFYLFASRNTQYYLLFWVGARAFFLIQSLQKPQKSRHHPQENTATPAATTPPPQLIWRLVSNKSVCEKAVGFGGMTVFLNLRKWGRSLKAIHRRPLSSSDRPAVWVWAGERDMLVAVPLRCNPSASVEPVVLLRDGPWNGEILAVSGNISVILYVLVVVRGCVNVMTWDLCGSERFPFPFWGMNSCLMYYFKPHHWNFQRITAKLVFFSCYM